jgi:hypothetical protein
MGKLNQVARAVSEGINGYLRGTQIQHGLDREKKEDDWREEQRTNARTDRERADAERRTLIDASKPLSVERPNDVLGDDDGNAMPAVPAYRVGATRYDTADAATAAAEAGNTPEAASARLGAAYRSVGKPLEAVQLESATTQGKNAQLQLNKGMKEWADEQASQVALSLSTPDQVKSFLSGSPMAGGKEVTIAMSADGKTFQPMVQGEDGNMVKVGEPIGTSAAEIQKVAGERFAKLKAGDKIALLKHDREFKERQREFEETKKLQREQMASQDRHYRAVEGNAAAGLKLQQDRQAHEFAKDPKLPPVVGKVADGYTKEIDGIASTINTLQGRNEWDPKGAGARELLARQAHAINERNKLLKPYMEKLPGGTPEKPPYPGGAATGAAPLSAAGKAVAAAPPGSVQLQPSGAAAPVQGAAAGGMSAPVDRIGNGPIGMLTTWDDLRESAAAGNQRAQAALAEREAKAERDTAAVNAGYGGR